MLSYSLLWFIIGIILILSEFLIPGFTIFFFGAGAIVLSLTIKLFPFLNSYVWIQILFFLILSIVLLVTLRSKFKTTLKGELFQERNDYTGKECTVIEAVSEDKSGRISFQGTTWSALSTNGKIKKNKKARIISKKPDDPMLFIIEKI